MIYNTGIQSLTVGVVFRNFSQDIKFQTEASDGPIVAKVGFAYNLSDLLEFDKKINSIQLAVDFSKPRSYYEQINCGIDYTFNEMVSFRFGYSSPNDRHDITAGLGFKIEGIGFDYSYVPWKEFDAVHQLSINVSF